MGTYTGSDKRLKYLFENGGGGGGGSANIWTGTKADYEAQASQISDDTAVFITDDEIQSLIVSSYDVYSTAEKEVGVWVDGKPLYQKTISANITGSRGQTIQIAQLSDIDNLFMTEGTFFESGVIYVLNEFASRITFTKSTGVLGFYIAEGAWNGEIQLTIQYTKASDVAGSGIFVPNGSAAVHYSTTEQVIGTWINGKPLYRKTFYIANSVTMNAQYDVSHDLVNIDEIVNKSGTYYDDADARQYALPNMRVTYSESVWIACFVPSNHTPILAIQSGGYRYGNISKISVTLDYTKTTD